MKLKPRTTYINNHGQRVCIAGLTGARHADQPLFWSIQGNHYSQDGRFVSWSRRNPYAAEMKDMGLRQVLLPASAGSSLKEEVTTPAARRWWHSVVTERSAK